MARSSIGRTLGVGIYKEDPDQKVLSQIGGIRKNGEIFNLGFSQLKQIADSANIPLVVCLHPETVEVQKGQYNEQGQEIIEWCEENHITLIKELDEGIELNMFRDAIHTNEKGHQFEAGLMYKQNDIRLPIYPKAVISHYLAALSVDILYHLAALLLCRTN